MTSHLHFEVSISHYSRHGKQVALNWKTSEARYHVWVNRETLNPVADLVGRRGVCYKNAIVDRGQPGHFETRHLSLNSKPNAEAFARAQQIARNNKLVEVLLAHEAAEHERKVEAEQQAIRLRRIEEAGPDLLAALRAIVSDYKSLTDLSKAGDVAHMMARRAQAAIARTVGDPS